MYVLEDSFVLEDCFMEDCFVLEDSFTVLKRKAEMYSCSLS